MAVCGTLPPVPSPQPPLPGLLGRVTVNVTAICPHPFNPDWILETKICCQNLSLRNKNCLSFLKLLSCFLFTNSC
jgi:hypothetical protein